MDIRYQVFVSSTYEDLQAERQEVMQALLELDCIPAGMELFPAANDSQWNFIKRIIGDCDYYVVIVAGRYGSRGPSGMGYTEMEYRFAEEIGKPTIAFLHKDPDSIPAKKTERDAEGQERLRQFRTLVRRKLCKEWSSPADLGSVVSRSLVQMIKAHPGIGWVRSTNAIDPIENARLRDRIEVLETELSALASTGPKGTDALAQGTDIYTLEFSGSIYNAETYKSIGPGKFERSLKMTWDEVMAVGLPPLLQEGSEQDIEQQLETFFRRKEGATLLDPESGPRREMNVDLSKLTLQQIVVQFRALGLVVPSVRQRSLANKHNYWKLTPYGVTVMTRLCALQRQSD